MPVSLSCHPDYPTDIVSTIDVEVEHPTSNDLILQYRLAGVVDQLELPAPASPERVDDLWQMTCFEVFIAAPEAARYLEFNFSPSTQWAAYTFERYRQGMDALKLVSVPRIMTSSTSDRYDIKATVDLDGLSAATADSVELGFAAVILEKSGRKSFWAMHHPLGKPDFHDRSSFVHQLEMAELR